MSNIGMNCPKLIIVFVMAVLPVLLHAAEDRPYYIWVDESGVLNISQVQPRAEVQAREVFDERAREEFEAAGRPGRVTPEEPEDESDGNGGDLPEIAVDLPWNQDMLGDRGVDDISENARALNCSLSRQVLRRLAAHKNIFMKDRQGLWRELSGERLEQEKQKAQQTIAANCSPLDPP